MEIKSSSSHFFGLYNLVLRLSLLCLYSLGDRFGVLVGSLVFAWSELNGTERVCVCACLSTLLLLCLFLISSLSYLRLDW